MSPSATKYYLKYLRLIDCSKVVTLLIKNKFDFKLNPGGGLMVFMSFSKGGKYHKESNLFSRHSFNKRQSVHNQNIIGM